MNTTEFQLADLLGNIEVRDDLRGYIPPHRDQELAQLKASILKEGIRDPLVFWFKEGKYVLIDGHHRYAIIKENDISTFPFKIIEATGEEEIKLWMLQNILYRRRLTPLQFSYLRGQQYLIEKGTQNRKLPFIENGQNVHQTNLASERLGNTFSVSGKTILRDAQFALGLDELDKSDPTLKEKILIGKLKVQKSTIQEIAMGKITIEEFHKSNGKRVANKEPKPQEIAEMAFTYICTERKQVGEVMDSLKLAHPVSPINFFREWFKQNAK